MKHLIYMINVLLGMIVISTNARAEIFTKDSPAEYVENFMDFGKKAAKMIHKVNNFPVSEDQFLQAVQTTKIEFTDDTLISPQGIEVDALNYSDMKLIRVNIDHWFRYRWNDNVRQQLVIHEYLGILKVDDSKYYWSQQLMNGGRIKTITFCNYEFEGRPYYLKSIDAAGIDTNKNGVNGVTFGEGTADAPLTKDFGELSSINFKWTDLLKGNFKNMLNWTVGIGWRVGNHSLHARMTIAMMSYPGTFTLEAFEMNNFNSDGVLQPQYFRTLSCKTKAFKGE